MQTFVYYADKSTPARFGSRGAGGSKAERRKRKRRSTTQAFVFASLFLLPTLRSSPQSFPSARLALLTGPLRSPPQKGSHSPYHTPGLVVHTPSFLDPPPPPSLPSLPFFSVHSHSFYAARRTHLNPLNMPFSLFTLILPLLALVSAQGSLKKTGAIEVSSTSPSFPFCFPFQGPSLTLFPPSSVSNHPSLVDCRTQRPLVLWKAIGGELELS